VLSRHEEVSYALRHAELFSSAPMGGGQQPSDDGLDELSPRGGLFKR
jgi:hypothetical protein